LPLKRFSKIANNVILILQCRMHIISNLNIQPNLFFHFSYFPFGLAFICEKWFESQRINI